MPIKRPTRIYLIAFAATLYMAAPALAQTSPDQPTSGNVAQQFKTGANRVGDGAVQIGQGIKQGAILTWQAMQAGAASVAAKFNGGGNASATK